MSLCVYFLNNLISLFTFSICLILSTWCLIHSPKLQTWRIGSNCVDKCSFTRLIKIFSRTDCWINYRLKWKTALQNCWQKVRQLFTKCRKTNLVSFSFKNNLKFLLLLRKYLETSKFCCSFQVFAWPKVFAVYIFHNQHWHQLFEILPTLHIML